MIYSKVYQKIWRGETFANVADPRSRLVAFWLLTNEASNSEGYYQAPPAIACAELAFTLDEFHTAIDELEAEGFCRYDRATNVVFLPMAVVLDHPKGVKSVTGAVRKLSSTRRSFLGAELDAVAAVHAPELAAALDECSTWGPHPEPPNTPKPAPGKGDTPTAEGASATDKKGHFPTGEPSSSNSSSNSARALAQLNSTQPAESVSNSEVVPDEQAAGKPAVEEEGYSAGFEKLWLVLERHGSKKQTRNAVQARVKDGWSNADLFNAAVNYGDYCKRADRKRKDSQRFFAQKPSEKGAHFEDFINPEDMPDVPTTGGSGNQPKTTFDPAATQAMENLLGIEYDEPRDTSGRDFVETREVAR